MVSFLRELLIESVNSNYLSYSLLSESSSVTVVSKKDTSLQKWRGIQTRLYSHNSSQKDLSKSYPTCWNQGKNSIIKVKELVYLATNRGVGEKNASKKYKFQDKPR